MVSRYFLPAMLLLATSVCFADAAPAEFQQTILAYQIEPAKESTAPLRSADEVAAAVKHRLAGLQVTNASVSADGKNRIAIKLDGTDSATIEKVKQSLAHPGGLEFRILADPRVGADQETIKLAGSLKLRKAEIVQDAAGTTVAKWVRIPKSGVRPQPGWIQRGGPGNLAVLVLLDDWNVTGRYLKKFSKTNGLRGPQINFELTRAGGDRFQGLTKANLPKPNGQTRWLSIIIDDEAVSAAIIQSAISTSGEITGEFSDAEVDRLIARVSGGELPADLRLISETSRASAK